MSITIPETLRGKIQSQQLIPLIGAGVSMSLKDQDDKPVFPSWQKLLSNAAQKLNAEGKSDPEALVTTFIKMGNLQDAAKHAREGLTGSLWFDFLKEEFEPDYQLLDQNSAALPKAIWQLGTQLMTLNYDKVLEWAHDEPSNVASFDNSNKTALADFARPAQGKAQIWHLHGYIDNPEHIILTPNGYRALYPESESEQSNYKAALQTLRQILTTKSLLFIGCSLADVELLNELNQQNSLFSENTGPHYALVRKDETDRIREKLKSDKLPIELVEFADFGQPLVNAINDLAQCRTSPASINTATQMSVRKDEQATKPQPTINEQPKGKIALLTANPLNKPQDYTSLHRAFKKFKCPIVELPLTTSALQESDDYEYLLVATRLTANGLLIEDDEACRRFLSLQDFESNLPSHLKAVIIITDCLPNAEQVNNLTLPLLILPAYVSTLMTVDEIDNLYHQLFKKHNPNFWPQGLPINLTAANLSGLNITKQYKAISQGTKLPQTIDKASLAKFTGRTSDLAAISRQLLKLEGLAQVLTVKGSGGLGKTTIVKKLAMELANRGHYSAGITFIDCEPLQGPQALELQLAKAFGLQQADDFLGHLHDHHDGESGLIILDNFESLLYLDKPNNTQDNGGSSTQRCKALVRQVSQYASIVITSRELLRTDWEEEYILRALTSDEGLALFNQVTKNQFNTTKQQDYLRRELLEPLLDNNPLAIKLISSSLPKGKDLKELKRELEDDFFNKISEQDLSLFDDIRDANINRQHSLYASVLYSYNTLKESERQAFEQLSLFPDGIDLNNFKNLSNIQNQHTSSKVREKNNASFVKAQPINDREITALSNKSLLENQNGRIKLQSIINRFAEQKFKQRENNEVFYQAAFEYNHQLLKLIRESYYDDKYRSQDLFTRYFNNLSSALEYGVIGAWSRIDNDKYFDFLDIMDGIASATNTTQPIITRLNKIITYLNDKNTDSLLVAALEVIRLKCRYYCGEFESSLSALKNKIPLDKIKKSQEASFAERVVIDAAMNIYTMEGDPLIACQYDIKYQEYSTYTYSMDLAFLGFEYSDLLDVVFTDSVYFEVLAMQNKTTMAELDKAIKQLHSTAHLEKTQLSYLRSRLSPLTRDEVDKLVNVNPFTRGLKWLMCAFAQQQALSNASSLGDLDDSDNSAQIEKITNYYRRALPELKHIKFYYMQGHYYFAHFLKAQQQPEYQAIYDTGLALCTRHHYRFWQHQFKQLEDPQLGDYREEDYPLPGNPDPSVIVAKQIKYLKEKRAKAKKYK